MTLATTGLGAEQMDIVYALAASPAYAGDRTCFAGRSSGLYGSHDGGLSWQPMYGSLGSTTALPTAAVVVSPAFATDRTLFAAAQEGVLRSRDGGETWDVVLLPSPPPLVVALAVSPNYEQDGVVFAGTAEDGVYHSEDRGKSWVAWNFGLFDLNIFCLAVSPAFALDETIYTGTESGIFQSTNGGRAWRELAFPGEWAPVFSLALSPDYSLESGTIYAGTESQGLFCSRDQGQTWERAGENVISADVGCVILSADSAAKTDLLVLTNGGVLLSRDDGVSWQDVSVSPAEGQGLTCMAAPLGLPPGAPLLIGLSEGTVRSVALPASIGV